MYSSIKFYHGISTNSLDSVLTDGIVLSGERVFVTTRPDIAFAYASKSGEKNLTKGTILGEDERSIVLLEIPEQWFHEHLLFDNSHRAIPEVAFDTTIPASFITDFVSGNRKAALAL